MKCVFANPKLMWVSRGMKAGGFERLSGIFEAQHVCSVAGICFDRIRDIFHEAVLAVRGVHNLRGISCIARRPLRQAAA